MSTRNLANFIPDMHMPLLSQEVESREFPGSPVVRTLHLIGSCDLLWPVECDGNDTVLVLGLSFKRPGGFHFYAPTIYLPCKETQVRPLNDEGLQGERESPLEGEMVASIEAPEGMETILDVSASSQLNSVRWWPQEILHEAEELPSWAQLTHRLVGEKGVVFKPINLDWFVIQQIIFLTKEAFTLILCDIFYSTSFQFF